MQKQLRFHLLARLKLETLDTPCFFKGSFAKQIVMVLQFIKEKSHLNVIIVIIIAVKIVN